MISSATFVRKGPSAPPGDPPVAVVPPAKAVLLLRQRASSLTGRVGRAWPAAAILLLAGLLRLPNVFAAWPYMNYVDEGHLLHPAQTVYRLRTWDPAGYAYPALPMYLTAAAAALAAPGYRLVHGESLSRAMIAPPSRFYDLLEPTAFLLAGRLCALAGSLLLVWMVGRSARELAGERAALHAMLFAALAPPLAIRGGIAAVDTWAALFVLAALYCAGRAAEGAAAARWAALAGASVGAAYASKYPAVLCALGVAAALGLADGGWRRRLRLAAWSAFAAVAAGAILAPATILRARRVFQRLDTLHDSYTGMSTPTLWRQAVEQADWEHALGGPEIGYTFLALAVAGLAWGLAKPALRRRVAPWLCYGLPSIWLFSRFPFQPLRNLLPLLAFACVTVTLLLALLARRFRWPRWSSNLAAVAIALGLLAAPSLSHARRQLGLEDSRRETVRWLAAHAGSARVGILDELAFLPGELRRAGMPVGSGSWARMERMVRQPRWRWLVLADPAAAPEAVRGRLASSFTLRAEFGNQPTPPQPGWWRGNRQRILIFERR